MLGVGMALMEERAFEGGRLLNPTFLDYKLLTMADMPEPGTMVVECATDVER